MRITRAMMLIKNEYEWAEKHFPQFRSYHEGYAILKEEVDELWDEIKGDQDPNALSKEAVQVATMAMRFLVDLCEKTERKTNAQSNRVNS